jgi:drug/metabolite transporter (DMT)-like permease
VFIKAQVNKLATFQLLLVRAIGGVITAFAAYYLLSGEDLVHLFISGAWIALLGVVFTGYFGADLLFVYALEELPLSYVFPIQASYPLITTTLAWLIFGDVVSPFMLLGALFVITGISLIGAEGGSPKTSVNLLQRWRGFLITILSSVGWAISALLMRGVLERHDPIAINLVVAAITAVAFFCVSKPISTFTNTISKPYTVIAVVIAGLIGGTGLSNLLFILTIEVAGVSRATVLASLAPLFTSYSAVMFLGEKLTRKLTLGTLLSVLGITLIVGG